MPPPLPLLPPPLPLLPLLLPLLLLLQSAFLPLMLLPQEPAQRPHDLEPIKDTLAPPALQLQLRSPATPLLLSIRPRFLQK